jgi:hypothetical protein
MEYKSGSPSAKREALKLKKWQTISKTYFATGCNVADTSKILGVSEQNIYKLLGKPYFKILIEKEQKALDGRLDITKDWKLGKLKDIVEDCMDKQDKDVKKHYPTAIKAINELNKMQGDHAVTKHVISTDANYRDLLECEVTEAANYAGK